MYCTILLIKLLTIEQQREHKNATDKISFDYSILPGQTYSQR